MLSLAKKLEVVKVQEPSLTESGAVDVTTLNVMNKLLNNCFKMSIKVPIDHDSSTLHSLAYGLQSGKVMFFPKHYLTKIDAFIEMNPDIQIVVSFDSGKSYNLSAKDFDDCNLYGGTKNHPDDDIVSLYVESAPPKPELLGRFMSESELGALSRKGYFPVAFGETCYVKEREMTYRTISKIRSVFSNKPVQSFDKLDDGSISEDSYVISRSINTDKVVTADGMCGSLYFVDSKILAMHVSATAASSCGLALSREDIEGHYEWHRKRGNITISEEEPTLMPVPKEMLTEAQMTHVIGAIECSLPRRVAKTHKGPFYDVGVDPDLGLKGNYEVMNICLSEQQKCLENRPNEIKAVNMPRLKACIAFRKNQMASAISNNLVDRNMTKLTLTEAINGIDDIQGMSRSSSMGIMSCSHKKFGLPKSITKTQYLGDPLQFQYSKYFEHCSSRVSALIANLEQGIINYDENPELYVVAMPKDEMRKVGKSARMVYCYSAILNAVIIMYFARCVALYKSIGLASNIAYINPFEQAGELLMHLTSGSGNTEVQGIDLDFAAWDVLLHPTFYGESLRLLSSYANYSGKDLVAVETLISILVRPSVIVAINSNHGVVMKMNAGLSSGSPLTSVGNSTADDLLIAYALSTEFNHLDTLGIDDTERIGLARVVTHGDDLVIVLSKILIALGVNYSSIAKIMVELGMKPQPISKDGVIVESRNLISENTRETTGLEFLCRNFIRVNGVIKLANKHETNVKQLLFEGPDFNKLTKEEKENRWNEFFVEVSQRGIEYYNEFRNKMCATLMREGLNPVCANGYELCVLHRDRIVEHMSWI